MDTLYTRSAPRDKYSFVTQQFGNRMTTFATDSHQHHRIRRAAINPFFSKQRVVGLQDPIWAHVEKLCTRFEQYRAAKRPVPTANAFSCLTADVIIQYSMGVEQNTLDDPDFAPLFTQAVRKFAAVSVYARFMPWIHIIINAIPQDWTAKVNPEAGAMQAFRTLNNDRVREIFERKEKAKQKSGNGESKSTIQHTVFDDLLDSDLPPEEKDLERLSQESQLIVGAGLDTTANSLNAILFHLLDNRSTFEKLKAELVVAMPDPYEHKPLNELEKIPYLTAVINEALRLSNGVSFRNSRLAHTPMVYKDYVIPARTPVGMSAPFVHSNESIFPDANSFIPERWLDSDGALGVKTSDGRPLDRFLIAFGRGARQCVGINLARAEMCICTAAIVRRFDMELFESSRKDVDLVHDLFLPNPDQSSKGVKVLVK
jgi:cytochrome P450